MTAIRPTSTIIYAFETPEGEATSYTSLDHLDTTRLPTVEVALNDEEPGATITVPLIPGYATPYDDEMTDNVGTEHCIFYGPIVND